MFLLAVVGRWLCNERAASRETCARGFKEWFPAAHHSSPPVKVPGLSSSSFYRLCLHRYFGRIFFGKRTSATCRCRRRTIVLPRQITHLSDRVKTKDRVTGVHRQKTPFSSGSLSLVRDFAQITVSQIRLPSIPRRRLQDTLMEQSPHRVLNFLREIAPNFFPCSR